MLGKSAKLARRRYGDMRQVGPGPKADPIKNWPCWRTDCLADRKAKLLAGAPGTRACVQEGLLGQGGLDRQVCLSLFPGFR